VVVGAGPGGCAASYFLKMMRPDLKILLIERLTGDRFTRYHRMCGEAISSRAFKELDPIRPQRILNRIRFAEEIWPDDLHITSKADGYIIDRSSFLQDLIQEFEVMGGEVSNESVKAVAPCKEGLDLELKSGRRMRCSFLIGADGACSRVRKDIFGEDPPVVVSARQYLLKGEMPGDVIRFHYGSKYGGGYKWEFPLGKMTKVGFPAGTDSIDSQPVESHARRIPVGGLSKLVKGRTCLIGDAAAQANPLTFGGIRTAMVAGRQAAEAISGGDLTSYERWWRSSKYSSPIFLEAYRVLMDMTEDEMKDSVVPFRGGYGPLPYARAYLTRPGYRDLYKAYRLTSEYGW
jgi:digeranylgeranylglycerophospholipid reductase